MMSYLHAWKSSGEVFSNSDAIAPWWSITKTVIAVSSLKLWEAGDLDLDEPLPSHPFTLRQLLKHTAGVPNYGRFKAYHNAVSRKETAWSAEELLSVVKSDDLDFVPGTGWSYSNTGYLLVRQVLEETTGKALADLIQHMVFEPLALKSASIVRTTAELKKCLYMKNTGYDVGWVYHGLAIGTATDAVRFLDHILHSDFLMPASRSALQDRIEVGGALAGRPWLTHGYGLGTMCGEIKSAGLGIGHSGASPFCVSALYHFPDLPVPVTACAFHTGVDEGKTEWEVLRLAQECQ